MPAVATQLWLQLAQRPKHEFVTAWELYSAQRNATRYARNGVYPCFQSGLFVSPHLVLSQLNPVSFRLDLGIAFFFFPRYRCATSRRCRRVGLSDLAWLILLLLLFLGTQLLHNFGVWSACVIQMSVLVGRRGTRKLGAVCFGEWYTSYPLRYRNIPALSSINTTPSGH